MNDPAATNIVTDAYTEALVSIRKDHGDRMAMSMARGMLVASCYMIRLISGPRAAAKELYSLADRYACE